MPALVIIFSADAARGNILLKALQQNDFEVLLHHKIVDAYDIINKDIPAVVILDTKDFFLKELECFQRSCHLLPESALIILAASSEAYPFDYKEIKNQVRLSDPLDPELIVSKVKEIFFSKEGEDSLESNLKRLLDLDD